MIDYDIRDILMRKGMSDPKAAMDAVNAVVRASVWCVDGEKLTHAATSGTSEDFSRILFDVFPTLIEAAKAVIAWADADAAGRQALQGHGMDLSDALRQSEAAEARLRAVAKTLKGGVK